jgi:hypothetical protein
MSRALVIAIVLLASCSTPAAVASPSVSTPTATASVTPTRTAQPTPTPAPSTTPSATPSLLPIFDGHLHYSRASWTKYPPERIASMLDTLGVRAAFVSSAPDEGTFRLRALLGDRIVPVLGPYRTGQDVFSWTRDGTVLPYLESAYRPGTHKGLGEFHLNAGQVGLPVVQSVLAFASSHNLFRQVHGDARAAA